MLAFADVQKNLVEILPENTPAVVKDWKRKLISSCPEMYIKQANYGSVVILTYAVFEKYLLGLFEEVLEKYPYIHGEFEKMPLKTQEAISDGLGQYLVSTKEKVARDERMLRIDNYRGALFGEPVFKFPPEYFFKEKRNFNLDIVRNAMMCLGIEEPLKHVSNHPRMKAHIEIERDNRGSVDSILKDIVLRRNEVAHEFNMSNIVGPEEIALNLKFIETLSAAINSCVLTWAILKMIESKKLSANYLGTVSHCYSHNVAVFKSGHTEIACGEKLIHLSDSNTFVTTAIEYQKDSVKLLKSTLEIGDEIGVTLNQKAVNGARLFQYGY